MSLANTLYAKYIKARQGLEVLDEGYGFVTYKFNNEECFICDMKVDDDLQGKGWGRKIVAKLEAMAKSSGCKFISANIHTDDPGASNTLLAALTVGFRVVNAQDKVLMIVKDIKEDRNG